MNVILLKQVQYLGLWEALKLFCEILNKWM
jgi:hypothetical protein